MKVTSIHIARKFYLGNYETIEVYAEADLDFGESFDAAFKALDFLVMSKRPAASASPEPRQQKNGYYGQGRQGS
jgi:hypothetical protein